MSEEYGKPAIQPIALDFAHSHAPASGKDVLGIVQSAFDELGPATDRLIEVKREVLAEVSEGRLAHALRKAIVGAGKAGCTCCS